MFIIDTITDVPPPPPQSPLHQLPHVAEAEPHSWQAPSAVGVCGPGPAAHVLSCYCDTQLGPIYLQAVARESGALGPYACPASDLLYDHDQIPCPSTPQLPHR